MAVFGSAPWVRGTPKKNSCKVKNRRFSPVGTGNTLCLTKPPQAQPVQPRGYGEHPGNPCLVTGSGGSAPWVRGTHYHSPFLRVYCRFSPVGTGNTHATRIQALFQAVQPRGYGEHPPLTHWAYNSRGSAPWVRGTLVSF